MRPCSSAEFACSKRREYVLLTLKGDCLQREQRILFHMYQVCFSASVPYPLARGQACWTAFSRHLPLTKRVAFQAKNGGPLVPSSLVREKHPPNAILEQAIAECSPGGPKGFWEAANEASVCLAWRAFYVYVFKAGRVQIHSFCVFFFAKVKYALKIHVQSSNTPLQRYTHQHVAVIFKPFY